MNVSLVGSSLQVANFAGKSLFVLFVFNYCNLFVKYQYNSKKQSNLKIPL